MIRSFLSIIDRLIKLKEYRDQRADNRFKDIFQPVFDELLQVHQDYISMFSDFNDILPDIKPEVCYGAVEYEDEKYGSVDRQKLIDAVYVLKVRRRNLEPLRVKIRALSDSLISFNLDRYERHFVDSIMAYMAPVKAYMDDVVSPGHSVAQGTVEIIEERLSEKVVNPSMSAKGMFDIIISIRFYIDSTTDHLRSNWSSVCKNFTELQLNANPNIK